MRGVHGPNLSCHRRHPVLLRRRWGDRVAPAHGVGIRRARPRSGGRCGLLARAACAMSSDPENPNDTLDRKLALAFDKLLGKTVFQTELEDWLDGKREDDYRL